MQLLVFLIKRIVMSICMIYAFDLITSTIGLIIPINNITIVLIACLGIPGIIGLIIISEYV